MNSKQKIRRNSITYLLLGLIALTSIYAYRKAKDYKKIETVFHQEKVDLQNELDGLIDDYKDLSVKKKDLSKRLIKEINKIIVLRDSVKLLKVANYSLIRKYRRRITTLERENHKLFARVDSLKFVNKELLDINSIAAEELTYKDKKAERLAKNNRILKKYQRALRKKVAIASTIKVSKVHASAKKERSSGKLESTSRSNRTDAFEVKFKLLENEVARAGEKKIHVQIIDNEDNIIAAKGTTKLRDKSEIVFSDELVANYRNEEMDVFSIVLVNRENIKSGTYTVNTFVDGKYSDTAKIVLK